MSTSSPDHPFPAPTRRSEPGVAFLGAAAVLAGQLMTRTGGLWLLLDCAGVLAALFATTSLLHRVGREVGRRPLGDVGNVLAAAGITGVLLLIALRGPVQRLTEWVLFLIAAFIGLLAVFVLGSALPRLKGGSDGGTRANPADRRALTMTALATGVAVLVVIIDGIVR
jgi:hypothetical protein